MDLNISSARDRRAETVDALEQDVKKAVCLNMGWFVGHWRELLMHVLLWMVIGIPTLLFLYAKHVGLLYLPPLSEQKRSERLERKH